MSYKLAHQRLNSYTFRLGKGFLKAIEKAQNAEDKTKYSSPKFNLCSLKHVMNEGMNYS